MARIFIGNLGEDCRERDIEKLFKDCGKITEIDLKGVYGFLNFDDKRDAADAIRYMDGKSFNGGRIRVDRANPIRTDRDRGRDRFGGGGRSGGGRSGGGGGGGRWSNYRLIVENLSYRTSWQDLKDYMREAGDVIFTKTNSPREGEGVVEFAEREGMEYALRKLHDTELDGRRIRLVEENKRGGGRRSRSRSRSRGRRDRSGSRSRSRSRGKRFRSPSKSRSRSAEKKRRSRSGSNDRKRYRSESNDRKDRSRSPSNDHAGRPRSPSRSRGRSSEEKYKSRSQSREVKQGRTPSRSPENQRNQRSRSRSKDISDRE